MVKVGRNRLGGWIALAALGMANLAMAQLPGGSAGAGLNPALTRLFGDVKAFTAKVQADVTDGQGNKVASTPMDWSYLNKLLRMDIDLEKVASPGQAAVMIPTLKKMNMVQITTVLRPDKKQVYVLWPGQQVALITPLATDDASVSDSTKISRTPLGSETIDGRACTKHKVTITGGKGEVTEAFTWNAGDLKGFPIQIEIKESDHTSRLRFKDVVLAQPAPGKFEIPAGYRQYRDQQEMMQEILKRVEGAGSRK